MMLRGYIRYAVALLVAFVLGSCAVHEWPDSKPFDVDLTLNLEYKTAMPLYDIIYQSTTRQNGDDQEWDVRYTVEFYECNAEGAYREDRPVFRKVFLKEDFRTSNDFGNVVQMKVPAANYQIKVWTDLVPHQTAPANYFYDAANFSRVGLIMSRYRGSTDLRDAFTGGTHLDLSDYIRAGMSAETTIESERPLAKVEFITTDVEEFISKYLAKKEKEGKELTRTEYDDLKQLKNLKVKITYSYNMPTVFSIHENKPKASEPRPSFYSNIVPLGNNEASMAFDYIFVNGDEAPQVMDLEVFDEDNLILSRMLYMNITIKRSHLTIVRSKFLTADIQGGAVINPDFEPDDDNFIYWIE